MLDSEILGKLFYLTKDHQRKILEVLYTNQSKALQLTTCSELLKPHCNKYEIQYFIQTMVTLFGLSKRVGYDKYVGVINVLNIPEKVKQILIVAKSKESSIHHVPYKLYWRLDVSVPKAPAVLMNIKHSSGESISFRLDISSFHKLRFNVALILKEMASMRKNSTRIRF